MPSKVFTGNWIPSREFDRLIIPDSADRKELIGGLSRVPSVSEGEGVGDF
jgi:hypothetical protein